MMKYRSWDDWIARYQTSHQNRWNQLTHTFGIPMIVAALALAPLALIFPALWPWAAVLFVAGWVLQFIGHASAGKPPEFLSDWRFLRRHALVVEEGHRAGMSGRGPRFFVRKILGFCGQPSMRMRAFDGSKGLSSTTTASQSSRFIRTLSLVPTSARSGRT